MQTLLFVFVFVIPKVFSVSRTVRVWKGFALYFLPLETSDTAVQWFSRWNVTLKRAKTAERNSTTCECIFHQLAVKSVNVNVVITIYCQHHWIFLRQKKIISIHYLTGQDRGLSGLKNIWPVIMTGNLLTVILSPEVPKKLNFNSVFFPFSKLKTGIKVHPFIGSGSYGY